jgi:hypothetical protein
MLRRNILPFPPNLPHSKNCPRVLLSLEADSRKGGRRYAYRRVDASMPTSHFTTLLLSVSDRQAPEKYLNLFRWIGRASWVSRFDHVLQEAEFPLMVTDRLWNC